MRRSTNGILSGMGLLNVIPIPKVLSKKPVSRKEPLCLLARTAPLLWLSTLWKGHRERSQLQRKKQGAHDPRGDKWP